ncbi:MAG TPA: Ppx/GppA phosphatase family protein [Acidimicrobiales bacterium]|nr:Ppx/GppA phosphatase family protein [Acidimicrobiales bacterium]
MPDQPRPGGAAPTAGGPGAVAAVDCGTNSTRLLVADRSGRPIQRLMEITRLGAGVDRTGRLDPAAIDRTVEVLGRYRQVADGHGVVALRVTATSAARDAANSDEFFAAATDAIGATPELLSGDDEGRLSFAGATTDLPPGYDGQVLVADIGGGSTELVAGTPHHQPAAVRSLDIGCVRVTERFLADDPPTEAQLADATAYVEGLLDDALAAQPAFADATGLVGLAGTVAALVALDRRLERYDRALVHHAALTRTTVERLLAELSAEPAAARLRRPGMEPARSDVIVGGAIVLAALMRRLGVDECLHSEADILDGLVRSLLG